MITDLKSGCRCEFCGRFFFCAAPLHTFADAIPSPHIRFKTRSGVKVQLSVDLARTNGAPGQLLYKMRARRVDVASKGSRRPRLGV